MDGIITIVGIPTVNIVAVVGTLLYMMALVYSMAAYGLAGGVRRMYRYNTHDAPPSIARGYALRKVWRFL